MTQQSTNTRKYAKGNKASIEALALAIHNKLKKEKGYIAHRWAVPEEDVDGNHFIPLIDVLPIPEGVTVVDKVERKGDNFIEVITGGKNSFVEIINDDVYLYQFTDKDGRAYFDNVNEGEYECIVEGVKHKVTTGQTYRI